MQVNLDLPPWERLSEAMSGFQVPNQEYTMGKTQLHTSPHQSYPTKKYLMASRGCGVSIRGGIQALSEHGLGNLLQLIMI